MGRLRGVTSYGLDRGLHIAAAVTFSSGYFEATESPMLITLTPRLLGNNYLARFVSTGLMPQCSVSVRTGR